MCQFKEISPTGEIVTLDSCLPISAVNSSAAKNSRDAFHKFSGLPSQNLTSGENRKLQELLGQYSDIFAQSSLDLGHTTIIQHKINTGEALPIKQ